MTTLGVYGGGFKPFTTGHFAKLADAIRDNDRAILFYGMQQRSIDPKKAKSQKFRGIGTTGKMYDEKVAESIFKIYKDALERIHGVEVIPIYSQSLDAQGDPMPVRSAVSAIFKILEDYVDNPDTYEKVTVYGDKSSMMPYIRSPIFKDFVRSGKIQFGGAIPSNSDDYTEKLDDLMAQGEIEARTALKDFYTSKGQEVSDEDILNLQTVRGTRVRDLASMSATAEEAKRYLPPFLDDSEKDKIIKILSGVDNQSLSIDEAYLRAFIKSVLRA